jgi:hypothetical protein
MSGVIRGMSVLAVLVALVVAPSAVGSGAHASAKWTAKVTVPNHRPKARKPWPVKVVAKTAGGKKLRGTVVYHFLFMGQVVSTQGCNPKKPDPCPFNGTYRDVIRWPVRAVGHRITFQVSVRTRFGQKNFNWWVQVRRK